MIPAFDLIFAVGQELDVIAETADVAVRVGYFLPGDLSFHGFQPLEFRGDAFPEPRAITSLMARRCGAGDHIGEAFGQPGWAGNIEVRNGELIVSFPRDRAVDALTWAAELRGRRLTRLTD